MIGYDIVPVYYHLQIITFTSRKVRRNKDTAEGIIYKI